MSDVAARHLFTRLFTEYEQDLYRFVFTLVANRADADDLIQETLADLWEHFEEYDRGRPFLPWAYQFAYRKVLMLRRKQSTHRRFFSAVVLQALAQERPAELERIQDRRQALDECLRRLPEPERRIILLRYSGDAEMQTLARDSGQSPDALYKRLQRIRSKLFDCIRHKVFPPI